MINQCLQFLSGCCSKITADISENLQKFSCAEAEYPSHSPACRAQQFRASLSLPLLSGRVTLGALACCSCGGANTLELGLSCGCSEDRGAGIFAHTDSMLLLQLGGRWLRRCVLGYTVAIE